MATNSSGHMRDASIDHMVDLRMYTENVVRRMVTLLNRSDSAIFSELLDRLSRMDPDSFTIQRLESLLASVRRLNLAAYERLHGELTAELREFTRFELTHIGNMMADALPPQFPIARVDPEQVYAAAMSRPFQGALLKGYLDELGEHRARVIRHTIADGYVQNRTTDQIVRTLRGTRTKGYADGVLEGSRREVATIVRTALSHTAGFARDRMWERNADLIKELQWLSTLDLRTTPECQVRDGLRWDLEHRPIGHRYPWGAGPGRLHFQCRSTSIPVFKSLGELTGINIAIEDMTDDERASMDGKVPAKLTYAEWLATQPAARQDQVLGPTRGALFRTGELDLKDLYNARGEELTLEDLRRKAGARLFRRAGVA